MLSMAMEQHSNWKLNRAIKTCRCSRWERFQRCKLWKSILKPLKLMLSNATNFQMCKVKMRLLLVGSTLIKTALTRAVLIGILQISVLWLMLIHCRRLTKPRLLAYRGRKIWWRVCKMSWVHLLKKTMIASTLLSHSRKAVELGKINQRVSSVMDLIEHLEWDFHKSEEAQNIIKTLKDLRQHIHKRSTIATSNQMTLKWAPSSLIWTLWSCKSWTQVSITSTPTNTGSSKIFWLKHRGQWFMSQFSQRSRKWAITH